MKSKPSANLALRAQFCFGLLGDLLIRLQAQFDYQKAFHGKKPNLQIEVRAIA
jgi:plasmid maintenance system antidote protein VapI